MNFDACPRVVSDDELRELIDGIYCTRFFRQRPRPTQLLLTTLRHALQEVPARLKMFFLWGVHGKSEVRADDHDAMTYLSEFMEYVSRHLSASTEMTIVTCDTHAAVNRISIDVMERYAREIESAARSRGWDTMRMSNLWQENGISLDTVRAKAEGLEVQSEAPRLVQFARRYYLGTDAEEGARQYLAARLLERPLLAKQFQGWVHVTPVEPSLQYLQPELPDFYVWIRKRGCSVKPWFPMEAT